VAKVEFYLNGAKLGEDLAFPYSLTWSNVTTGGGYALYAVATDNAGARATSSVVNVTVLAWWPRWSPLPPGQQRQLCRPGDDQYPGNRQRQRWVGCECGILWRDTAVGTGGGGSFQFRLDQCGQRQLRSTAVATDNSGLRATSAPVNIIAWLPRRAYHWGSHTPLILRLR